MYTSCCLAAEYYYACSMVGCFTTQNHTDNADTMNRLIKTRLDPARKAGRPSPGNMPAKGYFRGDAHYVPQYDYVFNTNTEEHERLVDHILHFENLNEEFASLMKAYGLDLDLATSDRFFHGQLLYQPKCTAADLDSSTRSLIEEMYEHDFELGGYTMLERTKKWQEIMAK